MSPALYLPPNTPKTSPPGRKRNLVSAPLLALILFLLLAPLAKAQYLFIGNQFGGSSDTLLRVKQTDGSYVGSANFPGSFGGSPVGAHRMQAGPDGAVYAVDNANNALYRFDGVTGALLNTYTYPINPFSSSPSGYSFLLQSVTFGPDGNIYAGTYGGPLRGILKIGGPNSGQLGASMGFYGNTSDYVYGVSFDSGGNMYAMTNNNRIKKYSPTGALINGIFIAFSRSLNFDSMAVGPDQNLYVADSFGNTVSKYSLSTGALISVFIPQTTALGGINDIVWGADNNFYVATYNQGVVRYNLAGAALGSFVPPSSNLSTALSLAFGPITPFPQNFNTQLAFRETGDSYFDPNIPGVFSASYGFAQTWNTGGTKSTSGYYDVKTPDVRVNLGILGSYTIPGIDLGAFGGGVSVNSSGTAGLRLNATLNIGSVNVNYPVQVAMNFGDRSTLFAGSWFPVSTAYQVDSSANMGTQFPHARATLDLLMNGYLSGTANAKAFGKDIFNATIQPPAGTYNGGAFSVLPSGGNFNYDQISLIDTDTYLNQFTNIDVPIKGVINVHLHLPNIQTAGMPSPTASDPRVIKSSGQDSFISVSGSFSNLVRNTIFDATKIYIPIGNDGVSQDAYGSGFDAGYSFIDLFTNDTSIGIAQDFTFAPVPHVKLQLPIGSTVNWKDKNNVEHDGVNSFEFDAGDAIQIQMPGSAGHPEQVILPFTATYSLPNTFTHTLSLVIDPSISLNPLEFTASGSFAGYSLGNIDFQPIPTQTLNAQTFNQGTPKIPLYTKSFTLPGFTPVTQQGLTVSGSLHPAPALSTITPNQAAMIIVPYNDNSVTLPSNVSGVTTLTVVGTPFPTTGSVAYFSIHGSAPAALATRYVDAKTLSVDLPNKYLLIGGTGQLYVTVPNSTGPSNSLNVAIVNPTPSIRNTGPNVYAADPNLGGNLLLTVTDQSTTFLWSARYYNTAQSKWFNTYNGTATNSNMSAFFPGYDFSSVTPLPAIHYKASDGVDRTLALYQEANPSGLLWAVLPLELYAKPDIAQITVISPGPGGGVSNALNLMIGYAVPQVTSISPSVVVPGSGGFRLDVTGPLSPNKPPSTLAYGNFNGTSTIFIDGSALPTTFVTAGALYANVPDYYVAAAGTHTIKVVSTVYYGQGGGSSTYTSNIVNLNARYPAPTIAANAANPTALYPAAIVSADKAFIGSPGAAQYNLTVNGTNFFPATVVNWNGVALATQYVNATQVTAAVPYANIALPGTPSVTVTNPTTNSGGGTSNASPFTIVNAKPNDTVLTALTATALTTGDGTILTGTDSKGVITMPNSIAPGSGATSLVAQGEGFYSGSVVNFNGSPRPTTFNAHNALTFQLTAADLAKAGTAQITVTNPSPVGGTAGPLTLAIAPPPPTAALAGGALTFDGATNSVAVGAKFAGVSGSFTMECWVNPTQPIALPAQAISGQSGTSGQHYALYPTQGGINYGAGNSGAGISVGTNGVAVFEHTNNILTPPLVYTGAISDWTHIAVVYTNGTPALYINGAFVKTGLTTGLTAHPSADISSGAVSGSSAYGYYAGQIDEVRIWSIARSATALAADVNASLQGNETGLLAYYRLDEGAGASTTADATGQGYTGTLASSPLWGASGAAIDTAHVTPGVARPITLAGFDKNAPAKPMNFAIAGAPFNGALTGSSPTFTYTPGAGYTGAGGGADAFTYTAASNGSAASAPTTVKITYASPVTTGDGLFGQYYVGDDPTFTFTGKTPFLETVDATINSTFYTGMLTVNYTARWTGKILAPVTGKYVFTTNTDDGSVLYLNGVKVVDNNSYHPPTAVSSTPIALIAGQFYTIEMDYYQGVGGSQAQLLWAYPGQTQQVIPQANLFSGQAAGAWGSGTLNFEGIAPTASAQNVAFTFRPTDGTAAFTRTLQVPASGVFAINGLPQKNYILHIKGDKYLAANVTANAAAANVTGLTAFQAAGDSNNDNSVDSTDFGILIGAFNSDRAVPGSGYDPTADFNSDGFVDSADFGLLIGEFNNAGAN